MADGSDPQLDDELSVRDLGILSPNGHLHQTPSLRAQGARRGSGKTVRGSGAWTHQGSSAFLTQQDQYMYELINI